MLYFYNGKFSYEEPKPFFSDEYITVEKEDIMLSLEESAMTSRTIKVKFLINYFSVPKKMDIEEYKRRVTKKSLKKAINEIIDDNNFKIITLTKSSVFILFDIKKFLIRVTKPNFRPKRVDKFSKYSVKLDEKIPQLIIELYGKKLEKVFEKNINTLFVGDKYYRKKFIKAFPKEAVFVKMNMPNLFKIKFDYKKNTINVEVKTALFYLLYIKNK